jgi:hypothetical protein
MIFDSKEFQELRRGYRHTPTFLVPENIRLARSPHLHGEIKFIEETLSIAPKKARMIWKPRLMGVERGNFIGTWFEVCLYRWFLENNIPTKISPIIDGDNPDFKIFLGQQEIFIEAKAFQTRHLEYQRNHIHLQYLIERIRKPIVIDIEDFSNRKILYPHFIYLQVRKWLKQEHCSSFHYTDGFGTNLLFKINPDFKIKETHVLSTFTNKFLVEPINNQKSTLIQKIGQHQNILTNNLPYLLAVFLEDEEEDYQDILDILIGKTTIVINAITGENISTSIDKSGIISSNDKKLAVSWLGALVFKTKYDSKLKMRNFTVTFIQNPYNNYSIPLEDIKIDQKFIVSGINRTGYEMTLV